MQTRIDRWLVCLVHSMYKDVGSKVRVGDGFSEELGVVVVVHQGSSLNHYVRGSIYRVP